MNSPSCDDRPLPLRYRTPESVVVFARYGLVVATYRVPPHRTSARAAARVTNPADLLFSTAAGVVVVLAVAAGLVWLAAAVCAA